MEKNINVKKRLEKVFNENGLTWIIKVQFLN